MAFSLLAGWLVGSFVLCLLFVRSLIGSFVCFLLFLFVLCLQHPGTEVQDIAAMGTVGR